MSCLQRHRLFAGYYAARARQKDLSAALYEVRREGPIATNELRRALQATEHKPMHLKLKRVQSVD